VCRFVCGADVLLLFGCYLLNNWEGCVMLESCLRQIGSFCLPFLFFYSFNAAYWDSIDFFLLPLFRCNCSLHTTLFYVYGVSGLVRKVSLRF